MCVCIIHHFLKSFLKKVIAFIFLDQFSVYGKTSGMCRISMHPPSPPSSPPIPATRFSYFYHLALV